MTDAEKIAALEARLAALETPPPTFGASVLSALAVLGKPDSALMSSIRHALSVGGAGLATHGYATSSSVSELIGASMALVSVAWSILATFIAEHWLQVAVQSPATTTLPQLAAIVRAMPAGPPTAATVAAAVQQTETPH